MMHLAPIHVTTTRYGRKTKLNAKQQRAKDAHDAWLQKQGLHPKQLADKKVQQKREQREAYKPSVTASNQIPGLMPSKSIFHSEWKRDLEDDDMIAREAAAIEQARIKAKSVAPAFSKGAYQFITPKSDVTELGKKK
jgi:hypothetical protein